MIFRIFFLLHWRYQKDCCLIEWVLLLSWLCSQKYNSQTLEKSQFFQYLIDVIYYKYYTLSYLSYFKVIIISNMINLSRVLKQTERPNFIINCFCTRNFFSSSPILFPVSEILSCLKIGIKYKI